MAIYRYAAGLLTYHLRQANTGVLMHRRGVLAAMVLWLCASTALATPVNIVVQDGVLTVTGDSTLNRVYVLGDSTFDGEGAFIVFPNYFPPDNEGIPTRVVGVTNGIVAELKGHNDALAIEDCGDLSFLRIRMGAGNDAVSLQDVGNGIDLIDIETEGGDDFFSSDILELFTGQLRVTMGRGNDQFRPFGHAGSLTFDAGPGDDHFEPRSDDFFVVNGDATVKMNAGNDLVVARDFHVGGKPTFDGGDGSDALDLSQQGSFGETATIVGFETIVTTGSASVRCDGLSATIVGTDGADELTGTSGADVIHGLGGNDVIDGLQGNDIICGGDGSDRVDGGGGQDRIFGGEGDDTLKGAGANDTIFGEGGNDTLDGGGDTDHCDGGIGTDSFNLCETALDASA